VKLEQCALAAGVLGFCAQDCSGAFQPGVLTALVGVSGAGKTTLMDVLAGRKTGGKVEGTITVQARHHPQDRGRPNKYVRLLIEQTVPDGTPSAHAGWLSCTKPANFSAFSYLACMQLMSKAPL
jgi:Fe-S cluster assembly ATPase SufC